MKVVRVAGVCVTLALLAPAQDWLNAAPVSCESLGSMRLPNATVTSADEIAPGAFTLPPPAGAAAVRAMAALPSFCRVAATSRPTADSDIKIEVWMPASGWNGKFQAVGNGGWAGTIAYTAMAGSIDSRLCDREHRHRPYDAWRFVRRRPSREAYRLCASLASRDGRHWRKRSSPRITAPLRPLRCGMAARRAEIRGSPSRRCTRRTSMRSSPVLLPTSARAPARRAAAGSSIRPPHSRQLHPAARSIRRFIKR